MPAPANPAAALPTTSTGLVKMPDGRLLTPEFARIVARGELVVAVLGVDQPPFFQQQNGQLVGIDIDIAKELAAKLGVKARFNRDAKTFDAVVTLLANGDALDPPYPLKPYHGLTWLRNEGRYPFTAQRLADCYGAGSPVVGCSVARLLGCSVARSLGHSGPSSSPVSPDFVI